MKAKAPFNARKLLGALRSVAAAPLVLLALAGRLQAQPLPVLAP